MNRCIIMAILVLIGGCGTATVTPPGQQQGPDDTARQPLPDLQTQIESGIYSGNVTCEFERHAAGHGVVEAYTYDFNETFVFGESGLPNSGVAYNPENDQIELFGTVFDVTNRTYDATETGYVENAIMVGVVDGDRVNITMTWTFTDAAENSVDYGLDISQTGRSSGASWSINEECHGLLTK